MPRKVGMILGIEEEGACFNEAGAVMPRKERRQSSGVIRSACFNEAGAVMPRKAIAIEGAPEGLICFNEAGAVMPRKGRRGRGARYPIRWLQ